MDSVGEASVSLRTGGPGRIPETTRRIAKAALPQGSLAIRVRDALGELFRDEDFADLFPQRGRPALSPAGLALVSILQFAEACPTGRLSSLPERVSTGSTPSAWSSRTRGSTIPC